MSSVTEATDPPSATDPSVTEPPSADLSADDTPSADLLADDTPARPDVQPPGVWRFATPERHTLSNGIELLTYDIPGQYVISVRTVVPFPLSVEPRDVEGVASIMSRLLDEGTSEHSPEEFAELLERKGIALGAAVTDGGLGVDLDVPKRRLGEALDLLHQALAEPVFPEPEVDRHRKTRLAQIEQERALPPQRAAQAFIATHFDPTDRASRPTAGTADSITALTRQDIVDFHAQRVGPTGMTAVIAVVGGGDSAMEEATFLTRFGSKVYVIHRKDTLRASKIMQERAFANDKIEFIWNSEVAGITGADAVDGLVLRDTVTGVESALPVGGLFVAIGNDPRTHLVHGQLDLTREGTIAVAGRSSKTSQSGVFAAGDVIDPTYRQAVTAAASGTVAALDAEHYLASLPEDLLAEASESELATVTN